MTTSGYVLGEEELQLRRELENEWEKTSGKSLTRGPIFSALREQSSHLSVAQLTSTLYVLTDIYFAGKVSVGSLAAMALATPVLFSVETLAYPVRVAGTGAVASAVGKSDPAGAKQAALQTTMLSALLMLLAFPPLWMLGPWIIGWLGGSTESLELAKAYFCVAIFGLVPLTIKNHIFSILAALGRADLSQYWGIAALGINLVLDYWLVFGGFGVPALGLFGIAISTIAIATTAAVFSFFCLLRQFKGPVRFSDGVPTFSRIRETLAQSGPLSFSVLARIAGSFVETWALAQAGAVALAAFNIAMKIAGSLSLTASGIPGSVFLFTGQNFAAGELDRIRRCRNSAIGLTLIYLVPEVLVVIFLSPVCTGIFSPTPEVSILAANCLAILLLAEFASLVVSVNNFVMIGINQPTYGALFDNLRLVLLPLLFLPFAVRYGAVGVVAALSLAECLTAALSLRVTQSKLKKAYQD